VTAPDREGEERPVPDERFLGIVESHLRYLEPGGTLGPDARLRALGLDSMGTVDLLVDLEDAYGISIPDARLTPETFETPAALWDVVRSVRGTAGPDPGTSRAEA
jgi:acyl carrier protein